MRKGILIFVVCFLAAIEVRAQADVANMAAPKTALQLKLDEWWK